MIVRGFWGSGVAPSPVLIVRSIFRDAVLYLSGTPITHSFHVYLPLRAKPCILSYTFREPYVRGPGVSVALVDV